MKSPRIVIIGRPNVGKSTLFNRLLGRRRALVHDEPGVTRDRIEHTAEWWIKGKKFPVTLVDTGGVGGDRFAEEIENQVQIALSAADIVLILFDGQVGVVPADRDILRRLKQLGLDKKLPVIGLVNKVDVEIHEEMINDFYSLGLDRLLTVSAEHGRGMDDLQNEIATALNLDPHSDAADRDDQEEESEAVTEEDLEEELQELEEESEEESEEAVRDRIPRVAIVGRPNVGKSTMTNALLGEERMITSPIAGTTVDAVDSLATISGKQFLLIDTAGIRRKSKTEQGVEVLSVIQAKKALERAHVAILLLDGETGITDQDEKIGGLIEEAGCGVILMVNKWDTQAKTDFTKEHAAAAIRKEMGFLKYAPILFVSAKRRRGFDDLGDLIEEILHQRRLKIPTHEFTEWLRKEATVHNPANAKFFLCHQTSRHPPTFVCHVNDPEKVHFSLRRHLINALRERWGFMGNPVKLLFLEAQNRRSLPKPVKEKRNPKLMAKLKSQVPPPPRGTGSAKSRSKKLGRGSKPTR